MTSRSSRWISSHLPHHLLRDEPGPHVVADLRLLHVLLERGGEKVERRQRSAKGGGAVEARHLEATACVLALAHSWIWSFLAR